MIAITMIKSRVRYFHLITKVRRFIKAMRGVLHSVLNGFIISKIKTFTGFSSYNL